MEFFILYLHNKYLVAILIPKSSIKFEYIPYHKISLLFLTIWYHRSSTRKYCSRVGLHKFSTCVLANIKSFMFQSLLILFSVSIAVKFHLEHSTTQTIYTCRILLIFLLIIPLLHYPFLYNIANKAF